MKSSFDELMNNMVNPLENADFYALLLADDRYDKSSFSFCNDYNLGVTTNKTINDLIVVALKEFLSNVDSFEDYLKMYPKGNRDNFTNMTNTFKDLISSPNKILTFWRLNHNVMNNLLGLNIDTTSSGKIYSTSWIYFRSSQLDPNDLLEYIDSKNIKHKLYISVDDEYKALISEKIINKCKKRNLPYEFKVYLNFNDEIEYQRSDSIVIYLAEEEQVEEYVDLINEIINENLELIDHIHKPAPHLGILNDYIGYGFQPRMLTQKISYSEFLKNAVPKFILKSKELNIMEFLSNKQKREVYDTAIPEGFKFIQPSEWGMLKLQSAEECAELFSRVINDKREPKDIVELKRIYSSYFKRENLKLPEIVDIKRTIIDNMVSEYPEMPQNNMFKIDVEQIKRTNLS